MTDIIAGGTGRHPLVDLRSVDASGAVWSVFLTSDDPNWIKKAEAFITEFGGQKITVITCNE